MRREGCGGEAAAQIAVANAYGVGTLRVSDANGTEEFQLGFGVSTSEQDFRLSIDASNSGYFLCWCASERGAQNACSQLWDYNVPAGRLRLTGPNVNQESVCAVGQDCAVTGIRGVSMQRGDRLMILSDCGKGKPISGMPASGILDTSDGSNFEFANVSSILLSVPGIFRICFCRPALGQDCVNSLGFQARVGLMTANGPFEKTTVCKLGSNCTAEFFGVGLDVGLGSKLYVRCWSMVEFATKGTFRFAFVFVLLLCRKNGNVTRKQPWSQFPGGDQLWFTNGPCGTPAGLHRRGFPALQEPLLLEQGSSMLEVLGLGMGVRSNGWMWAFSRSGLASKDQFYNSITMPMIKPDHPAIGWLNLNRPKKGLFSHCTEMIQKTYVSSRLTPRCLWESSHWRPTLGSIPCVGVPKQQPAATRVTSKHLLVSCKWIALRVPMRWDLPQAKMLREAFEKKCLLLRLAGKVAKLRAPEPFGSSEVTQKTNFPRNGCSFCNGDSNNQRKFS